MLQEFQAFYNQPLFRHLLVKSKPSRVTKFGKGQSGVDAALPLALELFIHVERVSDYCLLPHLETRRTDDVLPAQVQS